MTIAFTTRTPLRPVEAGEAFFTRLCRDMPSLAPTHADAFEPYRRPFDCEDIRNTIEPIWRTSSMGWVRRRAKPKVEGLISFEYRTMHCGVKVWLEGPIPSVEPYVTYLEREAKKLSSDLAYIHVTEGDRPLKQTDPEYGMTLGYETAHLVRGIPDLPWATVFGPTYVELFGRERLLDSPCAQVEELGDGYVYMQLSATPEESLADRAGYDELRARVRRHLGDDAFWNSPDGRPVRRPAFEGLDLSRWTKNH